MRLALANAHTFKIRWPLDDSEIEIRIEPNYWEWLVKHWPHSFRNLQTAYEVLRNPNRIFSGLNRPFSNSSNMLCFAGKPKYWFVGESNSNVPFPPGFVYLVFLNERKSLYEFRPEKADIEDSLSPEDFKNRFGELIWKKPS